MAGVDFGDFSSSELVFKSGETVGAVRYTCVDIIDDEVVEDLETFQVQLSNDEGVVTFSIKNATVCIEEDPSDSKFKCNTEIKILSSILLESCKCYPGSQRCVCDRG